MKKILSLVISAMAFVVGSSIQSFAQDHNEMSTLRNKNPMMEAYRSLQSEPSFSLTNVIRSYDASLEKYNVTATLERTVENRSEAVCFIKQQLAIDEISEPASCREFQVQTKLEETFWGNKKLTVQVKRDNTYLGTASIVIKTNIRGASAQFVQGNKM